MKKTTPTKQKPLDFAYQPTDFAKFDKQKSAEKKTTTTKKTKTKR